MIGYGGNADKNDNGDKVVGGKVGKGALLLMSRSVGQTSHPMLPLPTSTFNLLIYFINNTGVYISMAHTCKKCWKSAVTDM